MSRLLKDLLKPLSFNISLLKQMHMNLTVKKVRYRYTTRTPVHKNRFGPLTNLPDYSFKDGRPVPYGTNQKRRIDEQRNLLVQMKKLIGQVDYAVERHKRIQREKEEEKQKIIDSKLKEKGFKVLESESVEKSQ